MAAVVDVPFYDPVIMGSPLYVWLIAFLIFVIVAGAFGFYSEVYMRMREVWGFRDSSASGKPMAVIRGRSGKIWFETVDYIAGVFKSINLPLAWIITAPVSGQLGKVNVIEVSDDWNIVSNADIGWAIQYSVEEWNRYVYGENLKRPEAEQVPVEELDLIVDWQTYQDHLLHGDLDRLLPGGVKLPPLRIVDWKEIQRYLPEWTAGHFSGYLNQEVERRMQSKKEDVETAKKAAMYLAAGGLVFLVCCGVGYIILKMMG